MMTNFHILVIKEKVKTHCNLQAKGQITTYTALHSARERRLVVNYTQTQHRPDLGLLGCSVGGLKEGHRVLFHCSLMIGQHEEEEGWGQRSQLHMSDNCYTDRQTDR